ncbi:MAG: RNA pseudouridine synthase [Bacteroidota bacterium]|nr:RNA pseudouridine synthase [Bacteroidota bacterium]MED5269547.1 RNA pseudouridine synthase [Bacteroidota bacterium]
MYFTKSNIIFEDNHLIIVNKPAGILVQGDKTGDKSLIDLVKEYLKIEYSKKGNVFLGLVNRIDRPTSGIVILSKTSKALSRMNSLFKNRKIKKFYWAIISKSFPENEGILNGWFRKNSKLNKSYVYDNKVSNSKLGSLKYNRIKDFKKYSLFEIDLETGRHHQIRSQFSKLGYPIVGDLKYGAKRSLKDGSIYLHSRRVIFEHPIKKIKIDLTAIPPKNVLWTASLSD